MLFEHMPEMVLDHLELGVYLVDRNRKIQLWNRGAERITGYAKEEIVGKSCYDYILDHVDQEGHLLCMKGCPLHRTLEDGACRTQDVYLRHKRGNRLEVALKTYPVREQGRIVAAVESFQPVPERKRETGFVDALTKVVNTDPLTGLFSRKHALRYLENRLGQGGHGDGHTAVLLIHLADTQDGGMGDALVAQTARQLRISTRREDFLARWGDSEFLCVFQIRAEQDIELIETKIRGALETLGRSSQKGQNFLEVCLGSALMEQGERAEELLDRIENLLYSHKHLNICD